MRGIRIVLAGLCLLVFVLACTGPFPLRPPKAPGDLQLSERVRVELVGARGLKRVEIELAGGASRSLFRDGTLLGEEGGTRAARFEYENASFEGRRYAGRLVATPSVRGDIALVNEVPLEDYVQGVVAAELVLWSAEPAELEAQAIASRTYAVLNAAQRTGADGPGALRDDVEDQAYRGIWMPPDSDGGRRVQQRLRDALAATRGQVLRNGAAPFDARFHAACGGHTVRGGDVFEELEHVQQPARECAPCQARAAAEVASGGPAQSRPLGWTWTASEAQLSKLAADMGIGKRLLSLQPVNLGESGRWQLVRLTGNSGTVQVAVADLRRGLGFNNLKSAMITRTWPRAGEQIQSGLRFDGLGRGHGVGLCQEGTRDYAQAGWSAEMILAHYYPAATLHTAFP